MWSKWTRIWKNDFVHDAAILAGGTLISQVIVLATLPMITRLYNPEEYGTYSVYISILGILLMLVSLSYENAISLPKEDRSALSLLSLAMRLCLIISVLCGIGIYFLRDRLGEWLHEAHMPPAELIFAGVLIAGAYQIVTWWAVRKKYFKAMAMAKCSQSAGQVGTQLSLSTLHWGALGLIIGEIIGRFLALIQQMRLWRKDTRAIAFEPSWKEVRENAIRYRRFPFLSLPSGLLNSLGLYLPAILFAFFYDPHVAGWFALGQRLLGSPMTLITTSISNVYLSNSSEYLNHSPHKLYGLFVKTLKNVFLIGLAIVIVFIAIPPEVYAFVFGEEWFHSGRFIRILAFMYLGQFVANAVGTTIDVMERQDLHLYRELLRTLLIIGSIVTAKYSGQTAEMAVIYFSAASTLGYMIHLLMSWLAIQKYKRIQPDHDPERGETNHD